MDEPQREYALSEDQSIPDDRLVNICKYRQGSECCKYIIYTDRFYCAKKDPVLKTKLDERTNEFIAQGDNCEGLPHETRQINEGS